MERSLAACYTLPHRDFVVLDKELLTRGVGDSGKGADLQNLGDLSKITVHNFGAQGCGSLLLVANTIFYAGGSTFFC